MSNEQQLEKIKPGTPLTPEQSEQLASELRQVIAAIATRRRHLLLVHDSLQNTIGIFLRVLGYEVEYEVPFHRGEWEAERVIFDIVATRARETMIVEVKDVVTSRDLGQVYGYLNTLQLSKVEAKVYLGTDVLNWGDLTSGVTGETVKELMEREGLGVILADKYLLAVFDNYHQLVLQEVPSLVPSEEPVG